MEISVVTRLGPLRMPSGYLQTIKVYQGALDPDPDDDPDVARVAQGRSPAVLVTTGDGDYRDITLPLREATLETTVELLVFSSNLRSHEAKARGDGISRDPGIYQIIEDIRRLLFGVELGVPGVGYLRPRSERPVVRTGSRAIWRLTYDVTLDVSAADPEADAGPLREREIRAHRPGDDRPVVRSLTSL